MRKATYDPVAKALYVYVDKPPARVFRTEMDEEIRDIHWDYNERDEPVGIEILDVELVQLVSTTAKPRRRTIGEFLADVIAGYRHPQPPLAG